MSSYIIQNFNWPTFFIAIAIFVLVSNIFNIIKSYLAVRRARKKAKEADAELAKLQEKLKVKDSELKDLLSKKEENK